jgi:4-amino-4-deoxy-L-arabinose transferase-like glycosyltransferase
MPSPLLSNPLPESSNVQTFQRSNVLTSFRSNALILIIALSIFLRFSAALYMGNTVQALPGIHDQISYDRLAQNLLAGRGFSFETDYWPATRAGEPTAHWSYLMTLYLAGVYALFGHSPLIARLIQALLAGVLMPWLTYRLALRLSSRTVALIAAAISAIYIYFFYYAAALMTETFFILAVLAMLNAALDLAHKPTLKSAAWLGISIGCGILLRQLLMLFLPFLLAWLFWAWGKKIHWRPLALALAIPALFVAPFTIRNYFAFGEFVLLNTNAGYAFFWANHPIHGVNFQSILGAEYPSYQELIPPELLPLSEAALDKALLKLGLGFVIDDPARYILLSLNRLKDYFLFWPLAKSGTLSNLSRLGSFALFLPFMLYGLFLSFKRKALPPPSAPSVLQSVDQSVQSAPQSAVSRPADSRPADQPTADSRLADSQPTALALLYLFILIYTAIHLLSWSYVRYRLPVDAVLVIFAALAIHHLAIRIFHRKISS